MAGFWFFLPKQTERTAISGGRLRLDVLAAAGLTEVLQDCLQVPSQCIALDLESGPDNGPGLLLYPKPLDSDTLPRLGYDPATQTWSELSPCLPVSASPRLPTWIGYLTADPPRPADLERREQIAGYVVTDAYGDRWHVPIARAVDNPRGNLPYAVRWDQRARPYCAPSARYAAFWEQSGRLWDLITAKATEASGGFLSLGPGLLPEEEAFVLDLIVQALQINYRVSDSALSVYDSARPGWLSQAAASLAANAICDMCGRLAWEAAKKKAVTPSAAAGVSSGIGEPAGSPTTAPAGASC